MKIAYVRVSTIEQNEARQVEALEDLGIDKWYIEKVSAKDKNRPKLKDMLEYVREGDTIYIKSYDRLARNTLDLLSIVEELQSKGVRLESLDDEVDLDTANGKFMITILGAVAEMERNILRERQKEGIAIAVKEGKFKGRQPINLNKDKFQSLYDDMAKGYLTKVDMADKLGISRGTLYNRLAKYEKTLADVEDVEEV